MLKMERLSGSQSDEAGSICRVSILVFRIAARQNRSGRMGWTVLGFVCNHTHLQTLKISLVRLVFCTLRQPSGSVCFSAPHMST